VIVDGVVLATPVDSRDLFALSLDTGAMLWSAPASMLIGRSRERWTLIGAGSDTVYLCGTSVLACRAPSGLSGPRPPTDVQTSPELSTDLLPRPAFGERWIVVPNPGRRTVLDRLQLRYENQALSLPWEPEQEYGNALLVEGALYMLTGKYLTCIYDWSVQERRFEAALQADPSDHSLALAYCGMLLDRARRSAAAGDLSASLAGLDRARLELEPRSALDERGIRNRAQAALHHALRLEAEVRARQADTAGALERLQRAAELAPTLEALRDTLIETARLCERRGDGARRLAALAELEQRCSALTFSPGTSLIEPQPEEVAAEDLMLVGQWVALERSRELRRSGDAPAELAELQRALADWGDVKLGEQGERSARQRAHRPVARRAGPRPLCPVRGAGAASARARARRARHLGSRARGAAVPALPRRPRGAREAPRARLARWRPRRRSLLCCRSSCRSAGRLRRQATRS
jgi:hypothetical protein